MVNACPWRSIFEVDFLFTACGHFKSDASFCCAVRIGSDNPLSDVLTVIYKLVQCREDKLVGRLDAEAEREKANGFGQDSDTIPQSGVVGNVAAFIAKRSPDHFSTSALRVSIVKKLPFVGFAQLLSHAGEQDIALIAQDGWVGIRMRGRPIGQMKAVSGSIGGM